MFSKSNLCKYENCIQPLIIKKIQITMNLYHNLNNHSFCHMNILTGLGIQSSMKNGFAVSSGIRSLSQMMLTSSYDISVTFWWERKVIDGSHRTNIHVFIGYFTYNNSCFQVTPPMYSQTHQYSSPDYTQCYFHKYFNRRHCKVDDFGMIKKNSQ